MAHGAATAAERTTWTGAEPERRTAEPTLNAHTYFTEGRLIYDTCLPLTHVAVQLAPGGTHKVAGQKLGGVGSKFTHLLPGRRRWCLDSAAGATAWPWGRKKSRSAGGPRLPQGSGWRKRIRRKRIRQSGKFTGSILGAGNSTFLSLSPHYVFAATCFTFSLGLLVF